MATLAEIETALHNADAAGDTEAATHLARVYRQMSATPASDGKYQSHSPEFQQSARMTANAAAALPELLIDMPLSALKWGANKVNSLLGKPENSTDIAPVKHSKDKFLEMIDVNPKSANKVEDIVQAALSAGTSAGTASALGKLGQHLSQLPGAQIAGAVGGTLGGQIADESGLGSTGHIIGSILGGVGGSGVAGMVGGALSGTNNLRKTLLTEEGQKAIAGRALYRQTTNPDQSIARLQRPELRKSNVPGSVPITAEVANDAGLAMAAKGLGAHPLAIGEGMDQINQSRLGDIAHSVRDYLNKANRIGEPGSEDIMNKLDRIKSASYDKFATGKDLPAIPVNGQSVIDEIDKQLVKFKGNRAVTNFLTDAKSSAIDEGGTATTFSQMWNARKGRDTELYKTTAKPLSDSTVKGELKIAGTAVRNAMNTALKDVDPEFADYLRRFSHAEQYKHSIGLGRQLAEKLQSGQITAARNAEDVTGANAISGFQAGKIGNALTDLAGNESGVAQKLTARQEKTFNDIALEMKRAGGLELGKQSGSGTSQNISRGNLIMNDILDGIAGQTNSPGNTRMLFQGLGKTVEKFGLTAPLESKILRMMGEGLIDPDKGLSLLEIGKRSVRGPMNIKQNVVNLTRAGTLGALLAR